ncbi:MAG: lytic transglycosylase domain-containing protein [Thermoanaerobaculia bacterium]
MILPLASLLLAATLDPRVHLVELQGLGEERRALEEANCLADSDPAMARAIGLDFLRGDLLERLGRLSEGTEAFAQAIGSSPDLAPWARYRLAMLQDNLGHPEVAAGIAATLLAQGAPKPLVRPTSTLLFRSLRRGGDCRLLRGVPAPANGSDLSRDYRLMTAECHLRERNLDDARRELDRLTVEDDSDLVAFRAAELWLALWPQPESRERARVLGTIFANQRDFSTAVPLLESALSGIEDAGSGRSAATLYLLARSEFWLGRFTVAAQHFARLANSSDVPATRADALYQQARCMELTGDWAHARQLFAGAFSADPIGESAGAALLSGLRLSWLAGDEASARESLARLLTQRAWRSYLARGAVFVAVSEIEAGNSGTSPEDLLRKAERSGAASAEEIAYWRGRLAELRGESPLAIEFYLQILRDRPYHPLASAARIRLSKPALATIAEKIGNERAAGRTLDDARAACSLLGGLNPLGNLARQRALAAQRAVPALASWIDWRPVPVASWPIWSAALASPGDRLLALGLWTEAGAERQRYFPSRQKELSFTLAQRLEVAGATGPGIEIAERLFADRPASVPAEWISADLRRLLFPLPYRSRIEERAAAESVDPALLAAVIREESRFRPEAVSPVAARGLAQLILPTARRLALARGWAAPRAEDLHRPDVAIALGSAYLRELQQRFTGVRPWMVAAYNAGEDQAALWQRYCQTPEPEEYLAKVGFRETRAYVVRVLESREQYAALYSH